MFYIKQYNYFYLTIQLSKIVLQFSKALEQISQRKIFKKPTKKNFPFQKRSWNVDFKLDRSFSSCDEPVEDQL